MCHVLSPRNGLSTTRSDMEKSRRRGREKVKTLRRSDRDATRMRRKKSAPTWPSNDNGSLIRAYPLFDALISLPRLPF